MSSDRVAERKQPAGGSTAGQVTRMRAAIGKAVAVGPSFLKGEVDADHMAHTMVGAVRAYVDEERAAGGDGTPRDPEARALQGVLAELMGCGSGYLAGRCDGACVARTMRQIVGEFATR